VTETKHVPREKTIHFTEYVRHEVEETVDVPVCRMVAKTVMVPADSECDGCGRRWCRRCR
jgi:hypothetical protein